MTGLLTAFAHVEADNVLVICESGEDGDVIGLSGFVTGALELAVGVDSVGIDAHSGEIVD